MYSYYDTTNGLRKWWKPEAERAIGISAVKIFYCFYGRNAWHSTWITRYIEFCMKFSLDEAKAFAEETRKQGNVFYIRELPALMFHGREFSLVITQINTNNPLRGYNPNRGKHTKAGTVPAHLAFGTRFDDIARSFRWDSECWMEARPPHRNSVVTLYTPEPRSRLHSAPTPLANEDLRALRSSSSGPTYYLDWHVWKKPVNPNATLGLARKIAFAQSESSQNTQRVEGPTQMSMGEAPSSPKISLLPISTAGRKVTELKSVA
jgi:hypothetical protein